MSKLISTFHNWKQITHARKRTSQFVFNREKSILRTAQISKFRSKIVKKFAKLKIEYSIETAHFQYEKCYFSSKWRWNFVGISRTCAKMSKFTENSRNLAKNSENSVKIPELIEKFNREIRWFNPVLTRRANHISAAVDRPPAARQPRILRRHPLRRSQPPILRR